MDSPPSHSPSPASIHRRNLVDELQKGHCAAEQLRRRLFPTASSPLAAANEEVMSDYDLAEAIANSFSNSLSIAMNYDGLIATCVADDCKIEDSGGGEGDKSLRGKDRRGCYKRRRRGQTWTREDKIPTEDSFAWRKYGQKPILNSNYPRNYYRCTHKDQGCDAIKQVQQISDDPPLYRTTYSGHHTCQNPHKASEIILPDQPDSSIFLSFGGSSNTITTPLPNAFFQSSNNSMTFKHEHINLPTTTTQTMLNQSSYSDYNYLSSSDPATMSGGAATPAGSDYAAGDVLSGGAYSCSASPHSLEMDNYMMLGQGDFDHHFQFECDI